MQIVIDIPDQKYKWIVENPQTYTDELCKAIANGTPLPKGHGRLIDADALNFNADYCEPLISKRDFDFAPTIIESDKESEDKNE